MISLISSGKVNIKGCNCFIVEMLKKILLKLSYLNHKLLSIFNTYDVENKIVLVKVHSTLIGFILTQLIKKDQILL